MLNPSIGKLLNTYESRYALVVAVSKRAREIAEELSREDAEKTTEKPVTLALDEMAAGKFTVEDIV